jgi:hypothetical protein
MQALEEGRRRAHQELKTSERLADTKEQNLEVRSHVLTLREGELDSRLRDRDRTIDDLNLCLRELATLLRKEQAARELQTQRVTTLETLLARVPARKSTKRTRTPLTPKSKKKPRRAAPLRIAGKRLKRKRLALTALTSS